MGAGGTMSNSQQFAFKGTPNYAALHLLQELRGDFDKPKPVPISEPISAAEKQRCQGMTKEGNPCPCMVRPPERFCCKAHGKTRKKRISTRCIGTTASGTQCRLKARRGDYCKIHRRQAGQKNAVPPASAKTMRESLSSRIVETVVPRDEIGAYGEYLKGTHWSAIKAAIRHAYGSQCRICRSKKSLHVLHRTYVHLGQELWNDVVLLCEQCHDLYHGTMARENT